MDIYLEQGYFLCKVPTDTSRGKTTQEELTYLLGPVNIHGSIFLHTGDPTI